MTAAEALAAKDVCLCPWGWIEPRAVTVLREAYAPFAPVTVVIVLLNDEEHAVNPENLYATAAEADRVALGHARAEEDRLVRLLATVRDAVRRLTGRCLAAVALSPVERDPDAPDPDGDDEDPDSTPIEEHGEPVALKRRTCPDCGSDMVFLRPETLEVRCDDCGAVVSQPSHLEPAGVAELTESPQHGSRG